jgi:DNA ligase-1
VRNFSELYRRLDATTKTNEKSAVIVEYLKQAPPEDAAWAIFLLTGQKLKQIAPTAFLRRWASRQANIPDWLFEETYAWVGDLAETISSILPLSAKQTRGSLAEWIKKLDDLRGLGEEHLSERLSVLLGDLASEDCFVLMKLFTGSMRVGVAKGLVIRAVAQAAGIDSDVVAHRLMGDWSPSVDFHRALMDPDATDSSLGRPYPFALANSMEDSIESLGKLDDFFVEWKWDGIRAQLIRRAGQSFLWSRGEERIETRYPEIIHAASKLQADCVLDGELLAWKDGKPLPFGELQKRIGRKSVGKKLLSDIPVRFMAFDILEFQGSDCRSFSLAERRSCLESLIAADFASSEDSIQCSEKVVASDWNSLARIRETAATRSAEGFVLKRIDSNYPVGRIRGSWWKWKVDPYTIDAVLIYAQRGHGRRAMLYTDFTFALWEKGELVPFAKAYSGLTDEELREVDRFVRANTHEAFGPVRSVRPHLVMELAFENIQLSKRHKCGLAVRFPRIVRWRHDKLPQDANQLDDLKGMISTREQMKDES